MREESSFWRFSSMRKSLFFKFSVAALSLSSWQFTPLVAEDEVGLLVDLDIKENDTKDAYTINFTNVSIIEYIRFVSKITGLNFVFNDQELQFNVTIVSEEPITTKNIMTALVQVLRINGLVLLEQENNLIITKNANVAQIPTIVSADLTDQHVKTAPIVTRIFRIKNTTADSVAALIKPMVSASALIEVSKETRQLIVTDIITNVDKIASLLLSLDAPHSPLEIETYVAKHVSPLELISLATQIVSPFAEGNPLLFVPQIDTNSIFIVSTPYLIERSMTVIEDLDTPIKVSRLSGGGINASFYVYKIENASEEQMRDALKQMIDNIEASSNPDKELVEAMKSMRWIRENNSLVFTGTPRALDEIRALLPTFDVEPAQSKRALEMGSNFLMYKPVSRTGEELMSGMKEIGGKLKTSGLADPALLHTIDKMQWVPDTNSLLFTGDPETLKKIQDMLTEMDASPSMAAGGAREFFIYKLQSASGADVLNNLEKIAADLPHEDALAAMLARTIHNTKWVKENNSLLITGPTFAVEKVKDLIAQFDTPGAGAGGKASFLIYKPQYQSADFIQNALKNIAKDLEHASAVDMNLVKTIRSMRYVPSTDSILFTGSADSLAKVQSLLETIDTSGAPSKTQRIPSAALNYVLYTPKYQSGPDLIQILCDFERNLINSGVSDQQLFDTISNLKWMDQTSSLVITGNDESIKKVQDLLEKFDVPGKAQEGIASSIETFENTSFLVYKLQYHQGTDIITAVKQVATELGKSPSTATQNLVTAINSLQWINVTNSLIATGEQEVLTKLKDLVQSLDVPLKQVFIEVLIIETSLANLQNFGVQWGSRAKYMDKVAAGFSNIPGVNPFTGGTQNTNLTAPLSPVNATVFPNPSLIPFPPGFDLSSIGDIIMHKGRSFISLGALVQALQTDADSTIALNPKLICQDTNNSTIFVGQNIPYTGSTLNVAGGNFSSVTSNIEYRDIGMNLSITPYLGNGDVITLEISNDLSTQISAASNQNIPPNGILTTHTSLNTRVHVPDRHFVCLTGMISDSKTHFKSGIPCLGGLPVIGAAFSENDRTDTKEQYHHLHSPADHPQL